MSIASSGGDSQGDPTRIASLLLFLDYDGVLHPDAAYLVRGRPELRAEGELFMWAPILEEILAPYPQVQLVLSTSWVRVLGFSRARDFLPKALSGRVIGGTWHSAMGRHAGGTHKVDSSWFVSASRHDQIARYVARARFPVADWVAVDDDGEGWDVAMLDHLILTDGGLGLSDPEVQSALQRRLRRLTQVVE
ncbi:HAD domain-containing protein [Ralstonia solanacearum species complex bacterium KE055]|uniref:HAD domain-containing protein n=1 Tax=Ralstonia solanacearum species complex bacterium KE055 TaxID=3119586 RepID=UPI001FF78458